MAFDPKSFIEKDDFAPGAFIGDAQDQAGLISPPQPGDDGFWEKIKALGLGVTQGATAGFADEIGAGGEAIVDKLRGDPRDFGDVYKQNRASINQQFYGKAEQEHPWAYGAGKLVGAAPAAMAMPGYGGAMAQGAATMMGESQADYLGAGGGNAAMADMAGGGAFGLAGQAFGSKVLGPALNRGFEYGKQALGGIAQVPQLATDYAAQPLGKFTRMITDKLTPEDPTKFGKLTSSIVKGAQKDLEQATDMAAGPAGEAAQTALGELGDIASDKTFAQLSDLERQRFYSAYASGLKKRGMPVTTEFVAQSLPETILAAQDMSQMSVKQLVRELNKRDLQYAMRMVEGVDNNFGATARAAGVPLNPAYESAASSARQASGDFMSGRVNRMQVPMSSGAQQGVGQNSVQAMGNVADAIPMQGPADRADVAKVLIPSGVTDENGLVSEIYNKTKDFPFEYIGLRRSRSPLVPGEVIPDSADWLDGRESVEGAMLNGTSAIHISDPEDPESILKALKQLQGYDGSNHGNHLSLIGSNRKEWGEDQSEIVLQNADLIANLGEFGKLLTPKSGTVGGAALAPQQTLGQQYTGNVQPNSGMFGDWSAEGAGRRTAAMSAEADRRAAMEAQAAAAKKPWLDMMAKSEEKLKNIGAGRKAVKTISSLPTLGLASLDFQGIDAAGELGQSLVKSGKIGLTPAKLTSSWLENPSVLSAMSKMQNPVGNVAGEAYKALQERGIEGLKSRLFTLQAEPWARKALVSATDDNDTTTQSR